MSSPNLSLETPILISGGYDNQILFWNAHHGDNYKSLPYKDSHVNCIEVQNSMTTFAVAGNPHVCFYNLHTSGKDNPKPIVTFAGHSNNVTSIGFEHLDRWFYSSSEDATMKIWDCRGKGFQLTFDNSFSPIHCATLHPNQTSIFACDQDGRVLSWDLIANKISHIIYPENGASTKRIAISPDATTLAIATSTGSLHIYNLHANHTSELLKTIIAHNGNYVLKCRFSPQNEFLATTSSDGTCSLWKNSPDGFYKGLTLFGHQGWVWDCSFSNDSNYILTASSDKTCKLWNIENGIKVIDYEGHSKAITSISLLDFPH